MLAGNFDGEEGIAGGGDDDVRVACNDCELDLLKKGIADGVSRLWARVSFTCGLGEGLPAPLLEGFLETPVPSE